jgi:hypothetical protein
MVPYTRGKYTETSDIADMSSGFSFSYLLGHRKVYKI